MSECCASGKIMRGTTPTNTFGVELDLREATVYVWYAQDDRLLLKKCSSNANEMVVNEDSIIVLLSQDDTLMFSQKSKDDVIAIQVGYVFANGTADRSNIIYVTVGEILEDGKMVYVQRNI